MAIFRERQTVFILTQPSDDDYDDYDKDDDDDDDGKKKDEETETRNPLGRLCDMLGIQ